MPPQNLPKSNTSLTFTSPCSPPHLTHTPLPTPNPNEMLITVHSASINPVDVQLWCNPVLGWVTGLSSSSSSEKGLGHDFAGTVLALGSNMARSGKYAVGDAVFGLYSRPVGKGTFAKYVMLREGDPVARMPRGWSFRQAAAVPLVVLTAFACLDWLPDGKEKGEGREQRSVVVAGASGGVGGWCVQLAKKRYGCRVVGVCSGKNADFVRGLGADEVVDYATQDVGRRLLEMRPKDGKGKFDLYIDCVGGTDMFEHWQNLLHPSGAYITIVGDKTSRTSIGGPVTYLTYPSQILRYIKGYFFGPRYANVMFYQQSELLEQVAQLAETEGVEVVIQDVVKGILDEEGYEEAWEKAKGYMVEGRARGKIVLDIK